MGGGGGGGGGWGQGLYELVWIHNPHPIIPEMVGMFGNIFFAHTQVYCGGYSYMKCHKRVNWRARVFKCSLLYNYGLYSPI